jgi:DNA primase
MKLTDRIKENIRETADIVEVISHYVDLKKKGSYYVGLSPFKQEKTPSFTVTPKMGIFKDFSTGIGGDVFKFLMEVEGWSFMETAKHLAERYHIELPKESPEEQQKEHEENTFRQGVLHAMSFACDFYTQALYELPEAEKAREYVRERKITRKALKNFKLGFAPRSGKALLEAAEKAQIKHDYLVEAGLIKQRDEHSEEWFDFFRNRLLFPISDPNGNIIAFGGRILKGDKGPKYINSSESILYHKGDVLYGIDSAKHEIRKEGDVILVEGYTDVIGLWQAGIGNVVASSGTALTPNQLKLINRYGDKICMNYDGDTAGQNAMLRGISLAFKEGLSVQILQLPDKEDPDSYVLKYGGEAFLAHKKAHSTDYMQFMIDNAKAVGKWADPVGQSETIDAILEIVATMNSEIAIEASINLLADYSKIGTKALFQGLEKVKARLEEAKLKQQRIERIRAARNQQDSNTQANSGTAPQHLGTDVPPISDDDFAYFVDNDVSAYVPSSEALAKVEPIITVPPYEKELIRLLIDFGQNMGIFVFLYIEPNLIKTPSIRQLFSFLQQKHIAGEMPSKEALIADTIHRELILDIFEERDKPSKNHFEKVGVERKKDKKPFDSARSVMRVIVLKHLEGRVKAITEALLTVQEIEKKQALLDERMVINQHIKRLHNDRLADLFELPDSLLVQSQKEEGFTYIRKSERGKT